MEIMIKVTLYVIANLVLDVASDGRRVCLYEYGEYRVIDAVESCPLTLEMIER